MDDDKLDALAELGAHIAAHLGATVLSRDIANGELVIEVPADTLGKTMKLSLIHISEPTRPY